MNSIFNHENLRLDEIMKRISSRNNFSPQKPLKKYVNLRQVQSTKKKLKLKNLKSINNSPKSSQNDSFFPFLPKLVVQNSPRVLKWTSNDLDIDEYLETQRVNKEYLVNYFNFKECPRAERLPGILRKKNYSLDSKKSVNVNKKKRKIMAHIPSVLYMNETLSKERNPMSFSLNYDFDKISERLLCSDTS